MKWMLVSVFLVAFGIITLSDAREVAAAPALQLPWPAGSQHQITVG